MDFADMLCAGPVYVHRHKGEYRAVWTPQKPDKSLICHGIGIAATPYIAIARAITDAKTKGWAPAT